MGIPGPRHVVQPCIPTTTGLVGSQANAKEPAYAGVHPHKYLKFTLNQQHAVCRIRIFPADIAEAAEKATALVLDTNLLKIPTMKTVGTYEISYKGHPQVTITFSVTVKASSE